MYVCVMNNACEACMCVKPVKPRSEFCLCSEYFSSVMKDARRDITRGKLKLVTILCDKLSVIVHITKKIRYKNSKFCPYSGQNVLYNAVLFVNYELFVVNVRVNYECLRYEVNIAGFFCSFPCHKVECLAFDIFVIFFFCNIQFLLKYLCRT